MLIRVKLLHSAGIGDLDEIKKYVSAGAKVEEPGLNGPLHVASQNGHLEAVKLLISLGANASNPDEYGWTPLDFAVDTGHLKVVKFLINDNHSKNNLLKLAAESGHAKVVKFLLDYYNDQEQISEALEYAIKGRDLMTVSILSECCEQIDLAILSRLKIVKDIEILSALSQNHHEILNFTLNLLWKRQYVQTYINLFLDPYEVYDSDKKGINQMIENGYYLFHEEY